MYRPIQPIPEIPQIPQRLRIAAKDGTLVPFVGAGVSRLAGCLSWTELGTAALKFFVDQGKLDHGQLDQLTMLPCRMKLSIAQGLEKAHGIQINYAKLLSPPTPLEGKRVHAGLSRLARTFVTTNYDKLLDQCYPEASTPVPPDEPSSSMPSPRQVVYKRADINVACLGPPDDKVIHIHGSVLDRASMVLTTRDYVDRYASHQPNGREEWENPYLSFLQHLFRRRSVLFIGYGLEELEILAARGVSGVNGFAHAAA